jgi:hypothetical protein
MRETRAQRAVFVKAGTQAAPSVVFDGQRNPADRAIGREGFAPLVNRQPACQGPPS